MAGPGRPRKPVGIESTDSMTDAIKKMERAFDRLGNRIKHIHTETKRMANAMENASKAVEKVEKQSKKVSSVWKRMKTVANVALKPFKIFGKTIKLAVGGVKKIFGFLKKIGSLTFGTLFKLFAGLAAITKINSLMKILGQEAKGKGIGSTGTRYRALERTEGAYGVNGLTDLASQTQNLLYNPKEFYKLATWAGISKPIEYYRSMEIADATMELVQQLHSAAMKAGGYNSPFVRSVLGETGIIDLNALQSLGKTFDQHRGGKHDMMAYYQSQKQKLINEEMINISIEYNKVMYELEDLWQKFAVKLGPLLIYVMRNLMGAAEEILKLAIESDLINKLTGTVKRIMTDIRDWYNRGGEDQLFKAFGTLGAFIRSIPDIWADIKGAVYWFLDVVWKVGKAAMEWAADTFSYRFETIDHEDGSRTFRVYKVPNVAKRWFSNLSTASAMQFADEMGGYEDLQQTYEARENYKNQSVKEIFSTTIPPSQRKIEKQWEAEKQASIKEFGIAYSKPVMKMGYSREEVNAMSDFDKQWILESSMREMEARAEAKNQFQRKAETIKVIVDVLDKTRNGIDAHMQNVSNGD